MKCSCIIIDMNGKITALWKITDYFVAIKFSDETAI